MKRNVVVSLIVIVMVMIAIPVRIGAQPAGQREPPSPPQAAIDACSGKSDGAACEFTSPRGEAKTGTCENRQNVIACKPNDGQSGDNSQGQPNSKQKGKSQGQSNSGQKGKSQNQSDSGQKGKTPPQAAIDACSGKSDGATCEFTSPRGEAKTGTCENRQNVIACKPNDKPNDGQSEGNSQNQSNSGQKGNAPKTPPQAAIDACSGKSDGAACEFTSPRGDSVTGTCETKENVIACKPNIPPQDEGQPEDASSDEQNTQKK